MKKTISALALAAAASLTVVGCSSTPASPEAKCKAQVLDVYDDVLDAKTLGEVMALGLAYSPDGSYTEDDGSMKAKYSGFSECDQLDEATLKKINDGAESSETGKAVEKHVTKLFGDGLGDALEDAFSEG